MLSVRKTEIANHSEADTSLLENRCVTRGMYLRKVIAKTGKNKVALEVYQTWPSFHVSNFILN
jgi:hypothetical protein